MHATTPVQNVNGFIQMRNVTQTGLGVQTLKTRSTTGLAVSYGLKV